MSHWIRTASVSGLMVALAGCVSTPTGPSVMVLPGSGKSFEQFRADDADCRQYASYQTGGRSANDVASESAVGSAVLGTVVGAAAGAAFGGHNGAGVGAGTGLLFGTMAGSGAAQTSATGTQAQYDNAYVQCMYAKGESVPMAGSPANYGRSMQSVRTASPVTGPAIPPPPPPGMMPPPPPPPNP